MLLTSVLEDLWGGDVAVGHLDAVVPRPEGRLVGGGEAGNVAANGRRHGGVLHLGSLDWHSFVMMWL